MHYLQKAPKLVGRFVPFAAIAVANCINIPLMRMKEINEGITVMDKDGNELGNSKAAAKYGIAAVTFSRIVMAAPGFGSDHDNTIQYLIWCDFH